MITFRRRQADLRLDRFVAPDSDDDLSSVLVVAEVEARFDGHLYAAIMRKGQSVFDALRAAGADIPFACQRSIRPALESVSAGTPVICSASQRYSARSMYLVT